MSSYRQIQLEAYYRLGGVESLYCHDIDSYTQKIQEDNHIIISNNQMVTMVLADFASSNNISIATGNQLLQMLRGFSKPELASSIPKQWNTVMNREEAFTPTFTFFTKKINWPEHWQLGDDEALSTLHPVEVYYRDVLECASRLLINPLIMLAHKDNVHFE